MLSKAIRPNNKSLFTASVSRNHSLTLSQKAAFGTNPGILHRIFNTLDKGTHAYSVARFDPTRPLEHKVSQTRQITVLRSE
jgi:hypothetical protein